MSIQHDHNDNIIVDGDFLTPFIINTITRAITTTNRKLVMMQYDNKSERYTFEIDRFIDGHDLMNCNRVKIHFININSNKRDSNEGMYPVEDMKIDPSNENKVIFTWLISNEATLYSGTLSFLVSFECVDGDKLLYRWSSSIYDSIRIVSGMDNSEATFETYSDELLAWQNRMETEFIPKTVDERYIEREFATSEEVAAVFDLSNPDAETKVAVVNLEEVKQYVDKSVEDATDLSDYYTKNETYTKDETNELVAGRVDYGTFDLVIEQITTGFSDTTKDIKNLSADVKEIKDEYVDGYEVDDKISDALGDYYTKEETYSKEEVDNLIEDIPTGGSGDLSNAVNLTTDQVIGGQKTFTTTPQIRVGGLRIPEEYQEIEFLKSTGTQYINTGIKSNSNIGFEIDLSMSNVQSSNYSVAFGGNTIYIDNNNIRNAIRIDGRVVSGADNGVNYKGRFIFSQTPYSLELTSNERVKIDLLNKILYKNGVQIADLSATTFDNDTELYVFGAMHNGGALSTGNTTIYSLKIYDNNILVRDYVPCYRLVDNVSGLYDLVNNQFCVNEGTGEFERGVDVTPPEVEYISLATLKDLEGLAGSSGSNSENNDSSGVNSLEILWENTSPSSAFAGQTITLNDNTCDFFLIQFKTDQNYAHICDTVLIKVGETAIASLVAGSSGLQSGSKYFNNRLITASTQNSVTFSGAWGDATHVIPVRVLGVKLTTNSGSYKELLWKNENPTNSFGSQTVSIKEHNYSNFLILAKGYYTSGTLLPMMSCNFGSNSIFGIVTTELEGGKQITMVRHVYISTNSITFNKCVLSGTDETGDNFFIPLEVYGVNS